MNTLEAFGLIAVIGTCIAITAFAVAVAVQAVRRLRAERAYQRQLNRRIAAINLASALLREGRMAEWADISESNLP